jgi:hypothetical protein
MIRSGTFTALLLFVPLGAAAQVPEDASVLPKGRLRISLDPQRVFWDERFMPEGARERWTIDFEQDPFGTFAIPSLTPHETAIRSLTGLSTFSLSLGPSTLHAEADARWTPLRIELGLSDRLTVGVGVPIVKTRVRAGFSLDTAAASVGWNPTLLQAGDAAGLAAYQALFAELNAAIIDLEANIAAGQYGCPTSPECAAAQDLLVRARAFEAEFGALVWGAGGGEQSPFLPLARTEAANELAVRVSDLQAEFATLSVPGFTQAPAFPTDPLSTTAFQGFVGDPDFGIAGTQLVGIERWGIGDAELRAKYLLLDRPWIRSAVTGVLRLPTGTLDDPDHFFDLASGDQQLDLEGQWHVDLRPLPEVAAGFSIRYVHQRSGTLVRRVTPHDRPIGSLVTKREVDRKLGDVLEISVVPSVFLAPVLDVYLYGGYRWKGTDRVQEAGAADGVPFPAEVAEINTGQTAWRVGGGLRYRPTRTLETGLIYISTLNGKGGLTPAASFTAITFRLYYTLFNRPAPEPPPTQP